MKIHPSSSKSNRPLACPFRMPSNLFNEGLPVQCRASLQIQINTIVYQVQAGIAISEFNSPIKNGAAEWTRAA